MRARIMVAVLCLVPAVAFAGADTNRGVQLYQARDRAAAKAEFEAELKHNDHDALAHYYLGRIALDDDDTDAAAKQFDRAVELDGGNSEYHMWYGRALGQQAMHASKLRQPFLARHLKSECERAVALDGHNLDARDLLVDFYSMAPGFMGGGSGKAREQAQVMVGLDPARGHLALGRVAIRGKDGAAAERELNAAIAAAPDSLRGYSLLMSWYVQQKQYPQAFATIDRYVERRPGDLYGPYYIGRIAAASGDQLERGEQGIRAFLAAPPGDTGPQMLSKAWLRLGQVLDHRGKHDEAQAAFHRAVALDAHDTEAKEALK